MRESVITSSAAWELLARNWQGSFRMRRKPGGTGRKPPTGMSSGAGGLSGSLLCGNGFMASNPGCRRLQSFLLQIRRPVYQQDQRRFVVADTIDHELLSVRGHIVRGRRRYGGD